MCSYLQHQFGITNLVKTATKVVQKRISPSASAWGGLCPQTTKLFLLPPFWKPFTFSVCAPIGVAESAWDQMLGAYVARRSYSRVLCHGSSSCISGSVSMTSVDYKLDSACSAECQQLQCSITERVVYESICSVCTQYVLLNSSYYCWCIRVRHLITFAL